MYKVTLAMPVYNVEQYIERALLSALNQTFESLEFIVVDDKGTDNSMDIVRKIISHHPRGKEVRIIDHVVNQGLGATRNSAIQEARGEYLYFMDSDDEITADCIQVLYEKMKEMPVDFVAGSSSTYGKKGNNIKNALYDNQLFEEKYSLAMYYFSGNPFPVQTWNKLYSLFFLRTNNISCIPYNLCEDNWFIFQVAIFSSSFRLIDSITYNYYLRDDSTVGIIKNLNQRLANEYCGILEYKKNLLINNKVASECPYIFDHIVLFMYNCSIVIISSTLLNKVEKREYLEIILNFKQFVPQFTYKQLKRRKAKLIYKLLNHSSNYRCSSSFITLIYLFERICNKVRNALNIKKTRRINDEIHK